jgi:hypothetical protein
MLCNLGDMAYDADHAARGAAPLREFSECKLQSFGVEAPEALVEKKRLQATAASSCELQVLSWVPLSNVLVGLYGLYLCAFGFQEVHSTTYQRAATIAALPLLLLIVGGILFGILLGYALRGIASSESLFSTTRCGV